MAHATQDGEFISHLGKLGQVLAETHAGHIGFDLLELAAVRIGRIRLKIKGIHVSGAATQTHEDRRLALGLRIKIAFLGLS